MELRKVKDIHVFLIRMVSLQGFTARARPSDYIDSFSELMAERWRAHSLDLGFDSCRDGLRNSTFRVTAQLTHSEQWLTCKSRWYYH